MSISLTKFLTAFSTSLALAALVPSICLAQASNNLPFGSTTGGTTSPIAPTTPSGSSGGSNSTTGGTPSSPNVPSGTRRSTKRSQDPRVLAVRRQEITDILAVLNQNQDQREKFIEQIRKGKKPDAAVENLKLQPEELSRIQAIMSQANTAITNLRSGQPSSSTSQQSAPSSIPQTQPAITP